MILSELSIRRPVAMGCLIIALTLLGINAYRKIGLELLPRIDVPYITILTLYPGASPEEIETDVAKRIEDAVMSIEGLKHVSSVCMENVCQTMLEFDLDVDVDVAAMDVREKLDLIRRDLPVDVEDPKIQKFDVNAKPIATLALAGEAPLDELYDFADNTLRDRLTVILGVADVQLIGGAKREVHVALDRERLAARGLTAMDVVQAVQQQVRTIPAGRIREGAREFAVKFDADYRRVADLANLEVANHFGRRCHIRDIGRVEMATEEVRQAARLNGEPCVAIKVVKKADANAVQVADAVRGAMDQLNADLPGGMRLVWVSDDGAFIKSLVQSATTDLILGIALTAMILFIFLYNLRSLLIVSITMPLTILIGLFFVQMLGYTLNTSTLIAMGMSVGILVTNSIVVLEAIVDRLDKTGDPRQAARLGAKESFTAVLASAATNVVVLYPLAVMPTRIGLFIAPLAWTMFLMTVVSLFISFTLTPMLCALLLKPRRAEDRSLLGLLERWWNAGFDRLVAGYRAMLMFLERRRWAACLLAAAVLVGFMHSVVLLGSLGSSMVADSDKGEIFVKLEFPTSYNLDKTVSAVERIERRLHDVPQLTYVLSTVGKVDAVLGQSSEGPYLAQVLLRFSDRTERRETIADLLDEVRRRVEGIPDAIVTVSQPSMMGGQNNPIELEIAGPQTDRLDRLALEVQNLAAAMPGFVSPDAAVRPGKPEIRVVPRRAVLSDLQSPAVGLGMNLRANLEGIKAGTYKENARNYDIVVKLEEQLGKSQVERFLFPGEEGQPIVLTSLGVVSEHTAPIQITRKDKSRVVKLFSQLEPTLPMGAAVSLLGRAIDERVDLPPGYGYQFAGTYEVMAEGQQGLGEAALISLVLVTLTLAAILESFRQPPLILVTIPLALVGIAWSLWLSGESLGIFVIMGAVMLIGIVVNNAILIMDQFNRFVAEGMPRHGAMVEAACEQMRPIVMITIAAVLGMMPLALGTGIGAEMRNGVGIASAGGIFVSGVLTVLVVPVLYNLFTRKGMAAPTQSDGG